MMNELIDNIVLSLEKLKSYPPPQNYEENIRMLEEKLDFFQNKNGTIDDLYLNKKIDYKEYKERIIKLNKQKNYDMFQESKFKIDEI